MDRMGIAGANGFANLRHNANEPRHGLMEFLQQILGIDARIVRRVKQAEHVHVGGGHRIESHLAIGSQVKICPVEARGPLRDNSIDDLTRKSGGGCLRKCLPADARENAVGTDH